MTNGSRIALTVVCSFFIAFILAEPVQAQTGNIAGTITDFSHRVLVGARVQVEGNSINAISDDSGRYTVLAIPAGRVKVTVSYLGLQSVTREVSITGGETISADFSLTPRGLDTEDTVVDTPDLIG